MGEIQALKFNLSDYYELIMSRCQKDLEIERNKWTLGALWNFKTCVFWQQSIRRIISKEAGVAETNRQWWSPKSVCVWDYVESESDQHLND